MSTRDGSPSMIKRMTGTDRNVGMAGGDLPSRIVVLLVLIMLTLLAMPAMGASYSALKISALLSAQLGVVFLMIGLFFSRKTHFAGITLIPAPLIMIWLSGAGLPWLAVLAGAAFIGAGIMNIVTRRCGVNRILSINSCLHALHR